MRIAKVQAKKSTNGLSFLRQAVFSYPWLKPSAGERLTFGKYAGTDASLSNGKGRDEAKKNIHTQNQYNYDFF